MKTKKGFTLSETLVTLAVLGIIISITVPALITLTTNNNNVNSLKAASLILKTATIKLMLDNSGTMVNLIDSDSDDLIMDKYCTKLNCIKKCVVGTAVSNGCFYAKESAKNLYGSVIGFNPANLSSVILPNGMLVLFSGQGSPSCATACGLIRIDINGFKGPNTIGRDIFMFRIMSTGLFPLGVNNDLSNYDDWTTYCNPANSGAVSGVGCAGRVLIEGKMNY